MTKIQFYSINGASKERKWVPETAGRTWSLDSRFGFGCVSLSRSYPTRNTFILTQTNSFGSILITFACIFDLSAPQWHKSEWTDHTPKVLSMQSKFFRNCLFESGWKCFGLGMLWISWHNQIQTSDRAITLSLPFLAPTCALWRLRWLRKIGFGSRKVIYQKKSVKSSTR